MLTSIIQTNFTFQKYKLINKTLRKNDSFTRRFPTKGLYQVTKKLCISNRI